MTDINNIEKKKTSYTKEKPKKCLLLTILTSCGFITWIK